MGYVQLPDDLKNLIEQQVAEGHAASEADFVAEAVRLYAGYLATENDIAAMVERADGDIAAGRYVTISALGESEAVHQRTLERLRTNLAGNAAKS